MVVVLVVVASQVVWAEEPEWGPLIRRLAAEGSISELQFMEALQKRMEGTVLGLQSGSYAQRVQVRPWGPAIRAPSTLGDCGAVHTCA